MDDVLRGLCSRPDKLTGLSFNRADVLSMDIDEMLGHLDWLRETRQREIEQHKKAADAAKRGFKS